MRPLFIQAVFFICLCVWVAACHSAKQTLAIHTLPNYTEKALHQVLFLDFDISRSGSAQPERVRLVNSIIGNGELKTLSRPVHTPYQLRVIRYYTDGREPVSDSLEHPLFRSVEMAESNGTLNRQALSEQSGHISIRFPYAKALSRLAIFSVTPDKGIVKIHTLRLRP
ncbi:hypothetical protein GCM10027341_44620 [Spirosoma knui]